MLYGIKRIQILIIQNVSPEGRMLLNSLCYQGTNIYIYNKTINILLTRIVFLSRSASCRKLSKSFISKYYKTKKSEKKQRQYIIK